MAGIQAYRNIIYFSFFLGGGGGQGGRVPRRRFLGPIGPNELFLVLA